MTSLGVLIVSALVQCLVGGIALHSWWRSGWRFGWGLLAVAFVLMAVRRLISLSNMLGAEALPASFSPAELVALTISALMVIGVISLNRLVSEATSTREGIEAVKSSLTNAQRIARLGSWEWEITSGRLWWSDEIYRIFGLTPQQFKATYDAFLSSIHPDDREAVQTAVTESLENHTPYSIEHRVIWPDGTERFVQEQGEATYDTKGAPMVMSGTVLDITARKRAEGKILQLNEELETRVHARTAEAIEEKKKAENYLALAGTMIFAMDTEGRVTMINRKGCDILGYAEEDLVGQDWFETIVPEETRPIIRGLFEEALTGDIEPVKHYQTNVARQSGELRTISWNNTLIHDEAGIIVGTLSSGEDITERLKYEHDLRESKEEAERANLAKSGFLSNMSHELRTPMNAILGFGQLLTAAENATDKQREYVGYILKSGGHLLELINEILDMSKIEAGQMSLSMEPIHPEDAILECTGLVQPMADKAGIHFIGYDESFKLPEIRADYFRLKQILMNLFSNAIKYNKQGGTVSIHYSKTPDDHLQISIKDTGIGIAKTHYDEIYQPFNRLSAENSGIEGTGVGLTLTKKLVELMDGRIGFTSTEGKGSTFWIDIPLTEKGKTQDVIKSGGQKKVTGAGSTRAVLYVEDNPANLRLMEEILFDLPEFELISAHSAELGIEIAESRLPDLIILDINLPGMSGYDALKRIKVSDNLKNTPIIALSANAMKTDVANGLAAGFDAYLTKPIVVKDTLDTLRKILKLPHGNIVAIGTQKSTHGVKAS